MRTEKKNCYTCGHKHQGFQCPECGHPEIDSDWKIIGIYIVVVLVVISLVLLTGCESEAHKIQVEPRTIDCYEVVPELYWCPEDKIERYRV